MTTQHGRHGQKDAQQPDPRDGVEGNASGSGTGREQSESLERREYRDDDGNVHHHTRTYQEQHGKEGKS